MNERLVFILLLCAMGVLWYIIGCWRRKAGEVAFAAARMAEQAEERDRYCRLAVMAVIGTPAVCSASHAPIYLKIIRRSSRSSRVAYG